LQLYKIAFSVVVKVLASNMAAAIAMRLTQIKQVVAALSKNINDHIILYECS